MPKFKTLGDRCKFYEQNFGLGPYLLPYVPALCRIDGRAFHSFCKGLPRPYDERLSNLMIDTTKFLVHETSACWGFVQSDEITLCWLDESDNGQIFFDYRRQKIETQTASLTTWFFNKEIGSRIPERSGYQALFDSRAWSVPNKKEAVTNALWRERDATKNSISMAASAYYSHKFLHGKNSKDKHELLYGKGINWNDYPAFFKRGTFVRRVKKYIPFSADEIEKLPQQHEARKNPNLTVERSVVELVDMPPFNRVSNKIEVLFNGESPTGECNAK